MTAPKALNKKTVKSITTAVLSALVLGLTFPVFAGQIHPLTASNTRPTILIHGIPTSRSAEITSTDEWKVELDSEITNHFSYNYDSNELVRFDGETTRFALSVKHGIDNKAELEIILPYISHDGGSLDQFIEDWHDVFGFPQNGRTNYPQNQLQFFYQKNGVTKLDFQESASGVGDAQIIFAVDLKEQKTQYQNNLTFKTAIKLATGDSNKLTGSGGITLSAWLAGDWSTRLFDLNGLNYYSIGGMWLEEGEVIADQQQSYAFFGGLGNGLQVSENIVLQAQLDFHTPLYKGSDMRELDSFAFLLTLGGNLKISEQWNIDIAVVEDALPHSAPDVTFHLGINSRW